MSFRNIFNEEDSLTQNGGLSNSTTKNSIVDLFFLMGASRNINLNDLYILFDNAMQFDNKDTIKTLFYGRDISKGMGERRIFLEFLYYLYTKHHMVLCSLLTPENIEYTLKNNIVRTRDYIDLCNKILTNIYNNGTKTYIYDNLVSIILKTLFSLIQNDNNIKGIVAKWMPRKYGKNHNVVLFIRKFIMSYKKYREVLKVSNTVEQKLSKRQYSSIDLSKIPSLSLKKYQKCFNKNGMLQDFIEKLKKDKNTNINVERLFPHEVLRINDEELSSIAWDKLKDKYSINNIKILPMVDVSESMSTSIGNTSTTCMHISTSLGLFLAEINDTIFKNLIITFTDIPKFIDVTNISGLHNRIEYIKRHIGYNTDISLAFELLLEKAVQNNLTQEDMPEAILIISDMEFDNSCINGTQVSSFKYIKSSYQSYGYNMPTLIFWNVNGRLNNYPTNNNDKNTVLLSGFSPNIVNNIIQNNITDPVEFVYDVINNDRYSFVDNII